MSGTTAGVVVGVDGGGTTTDVAVADLTGAVLAVERAGPSNHETIGVDGAVGVLEAALDAALATAGAARGDVRAAVFGLAGVDWPSDEERLDVALAALGLAGVRRVVNDSLVALRAGCRDPWGVVSSAGTGSVTAGVGRTGEFARTMAIGWGEPSGSGTLVTAALHAVAAELHGTGPSTALSDRLVAALGHVDVPAMFEAISRGRGGGLRRHAPIVTELADDGDAVAAGIVVDIARQHADLAGAVARRVALVDGPFDLVTAGAVHASGRCFVDAFARRVEEVCPTAVIVPLAVLPVVGGVRLALESLGLDASGVDASGLAALPGRGSATS
jgi:N-acetylglucosamine kinase-like BadF-type ATPase